MNTVIRFIGSTTFVWDVQKAVGNRQKHGVSFDEACTVFADPFVLYVADWARGEPRMVALGMSARGRTLFVVSIHVEDEVIRLISARKATAHERRRYEEGA